MRGASRPLSDQRRQAAAEPGAAEWKQTGLKAAVWNKREQAVLM